MKIIRYGIGALLIIFLLAGCSQQRSLETDMTLSDIAAVIMESQSELPSLRQIISEDEKFSSWVSDYYSIQPEEVEAGVICYGDGVEASEIAVLVMAKEEDCKAAKEALAEYMQRRSGVFEGYAPQQEALVRNGAVAVNGKYIALMICEDPSAAEKAFLSCFMTGAESRKSRVSEESWSVSAWETEETKEALAENEVYDSEAVLQAWRSGDDSFLSEVNRSIFEAAKTVIQQEIDEDMNDYEKELAIHDWITDWSSFDYSVFGRSSADGVEDGSDTPYGVLIDRSAMCHGYSSTFQLFMDMLDIECITVFGTPGSNGVEHSWNMVKLDEEWYCVDVAWDDPIGGSPVHRFFNVTSQYLRDSGIHRWDESTVPKAAATEYAYGEH